MATREVRTTQEQVACAVCGRTLLRGERAQLYTGGGQRRTVCDLCTGRAQGEGWVREGMSELGTRAESRDRRRPLLERLRTTLRERPGEDGQQPQLDGDEPVPGAAPRARVTRPAPSGQPPTSARREPRHVRAVPTSHEQRVSAALERFNASEYPRTVAGVARSLGEPVVAARALEGTGGATVRITVSWELCWYRYEVDLGDDGAGVRQIAQGYEPEELELEDREPVAAADERGRLEARTA